MTEEEVKEAAERDGFTEEGPSNESKGGEGKRLTKPGKKGEQVRIMPGNPLDSNPVKQGPYVRVSKPGVNDHAVPLASNPTL